MTESSSISTTPVLTGPNNFELWLLRIEGKLRREKVLWVATGQDVKPSPSNTVSSKPEDDPELAWVLRDEKAHGIITDSLSDALLLKTHAATSAKDLFDKLKEIHRKSNVATAYYSFEELITLRWNGTLRNSGLPSPASPG
ncbi:hypothetical protein BV22DRAFT_1188135 [Leucogyrophana mollusca]|uniref:Uncharacterized protein n=1 Tax=Leucogyrophana mollusca TaxID=85980 RepID=A0ACB8AW78_9AGAM|nr:hypothetical protein BV22DRAFT_1188135 [Leucogyrophana mollusca]